jgi:shikimate kinase
MTSGKTSIGPQLAMRLGLDFLDLDEEIVQQERMSIPEIFSQLGEDTFRETEARHLDRVLGGPARVLSTGGGVVTRQDCRLSLARAAEVVWLDVRFETVLARLRADTDRQRPLADRMGTEELRALHQRRRPLYASCASLRVDTDRDAPGRLARRIALHLQRADPSS